MVFISISITQSNEPNVAQFKYGRIVMLGITMAKIILEVKHRASHLWVWYRGLGGPHPNYTCQQPRDRKATCQLWVHQNGYGYQ